jgi:hypothetical protein
VLLSIRERISEWMLASSERVAPTRGDECSNQKVEEVFCIYVAMTLCSLTVPASSIAKPSCIITTNVALVTTHATSMAAASELSVIVSSLILRQYIVCASKWRASDILPLISHLHLLSKSRRSCDLSTTSTNCNFYMGLKLDF